jgi:hypothetical protein
VQPDINTWWGRSFRLAVVTSAAIHVVALLMLSIPGSRTSDDRLDDSDLLLVPMAVSQPRQTAPEAPAQQLDDAAPRETPPVQLDIEIPQPAMSPAAPLTRTIPPTTLNALTEPTQSLIVKPAGIGRRTSHIDAKRLAIARAESLLTSRLASLPGAGTPKPKRPIDLAEDGGVTVVIPWSGFLPADRYDEIWRADRCRDTDRDNDADKPGEAAARRAQC